ncbi:GTP pyrophosphokinase family protein [Aeromicrobium sp. IC_218]|uniref:GTP pyrophosphokinase n=1 Tax=Aeromicrobium sp. IC_218 TaxID=2545468 RepID=UPI001F603EB0|nr:GTP pyrophosphokinase family protein [Aeromicrobium sp. IC_218]
MASDASIDPNLELPAEVLDRSLGDGVDAEHLREMRQEFTRFMMRYKFGMEQVVTKLNILRDEFAHLHDYNPIEHLASRLKSPESLLEKAQRKSCPITFEAFREHITDIAGVRVTCSFVSDVYHVFDMLTSQDDVQIVDVRDYIAEPKPNGYRSLHVLVQVPVFLSDGVVPVTVEVQLRTIAMDFWASLEHKIYYKYRDAVPENLLGGLKEAAETAATLDSTMEMLHAEVRSMNDLPRDLVSDVRDRAEAASTQVLLEQLRRLGEDS